MIFDANHFFRLTKPGAGTRTTKVERQLTHTTKAHQRLSFSSRDRINDLSTWFGHTQEFGGGGGEGSEGERERGDAALLVSILGGEIKGRGIYLPFLNPYLGAPTTRVSIFISDKIYICRLRLDQVG